MSYSHEDYWAECLSIAAEECGLTLTEAQLRYLADAVEGSSENMSQAFGYDVASANLSAARERELQALRDEAERERRKVHCRVCDGSGRERYSFGTIGVDTECWKCRGDGRHDP